MSILASPSPGPCSDWTDADAVTGCCSATIGSQDQETLASNITEASELLFELSGRRFSGLCEKTVRPCSTVDWCGIQILSRGHVIGLGWDGWRWYNDRGVPFCGCAPLSRVTLSGYPVTAIGEVKIDGQVIDATSYRLDGWRYLTRVRTSSDDPIPVWPACQSLDLPDTEPGTFSVTYDFGIAPPISGQKAAAELACQLFLLCSDSSDCMLPMGVTTVTRLGVTFERPAFLTWAHDERLGWRTGLPRVDTFLNAYNRSALRRRPAVYSPDIPGYAPKLGV